MKKKISILGAIVAIVMTAFAGILIYASRFSAQCDPVMLGSSLAARLQFRVPQSRVEEFNHKLIRYLELSDYRLENSRSNNYLSPPDAAGNQSNFTNIKTIGCTARIVVWSENVIKPDHFFVTVHTTMLGNRDDALQTASELVELLGDEEGKGGQPIMTVR